MDSTERPGARFGTLLRSLRQARALSQESLAERSGLSVRGVSDLERGLKARPHLETVRLLADGLNLDSAERVALIAAARPSADARTPVATNLPDNLLPLIGRDAALAAAMALAEQPSTRLLTLTGPAGVGKTRLALQIGHELARNGFGPVLLVPLSAVASADQLLHAVAAAIGQPPAGEQEVLAFIASALDQQSAVLLLDNLEHLRDVAIPIDRLVQALPSVRIIATSRAPTRHHLEQLFPVPPLARLAGQRIAPADISRIASVQLFVERARAVQPDFVLTSDNATVIGDICDRLEGLPLAIELAARRARMLSLPALRTLLDTRLDLLADGDPTRAPRHRSLRAAIASSVDLLRDDDRRLLAVIAHYPAGATIEALSGPDQPGGMADLFNGLERLVDASLLQRAVTRTGEPRFTMLESVREYMVATLDPLARSEMGMQVARHVAGLVEHAEPELTQSHRSEWIARLDDEYPNIRSAFTWAVQAGEREIAYRIGSSLWPFWSATGRTAEGAGWLERANVPDDNAAPDVRARALQRLGNLRVDQADYPAALTCYRESYALSLGTGDRRGEAAALTGEGLVRVIQGDPETAMPLLERARSIWRELRNLRGEAVAAMNLGNAHALAGDLAGARLWLEDSLRLRQEAGDQSGAGYSLYALGRLARIQDDRIAARQFIIRSLRAFHASADRPGLACGLHELGALARCEGRDQAALAYLRVALRLRSQISDIQAEIDSIEEMALIAETHKFHEAASTLLSYCATWRSIHGAPAHPAIAAMLERSLDRARTHLAAERRSAAESFGRTMTLDDVVFAAQSLVI